MSNKGLVSIEQSYRTAANQSTQERFLFSTLLLLLFSLLFSRTAISSCAIVVENTPIQQIMSVTPGQAGGGQDGRETKEDEKATTKISKWRIYKNSVKFINLSKSSVKNRKEDNSNEVFYIN